MTKHPTKSRRAQGVLSLTAVVWVMAGCATSDGLEPQARLTPATTVAAGLPAAQDVRYSRSWPTQDWWRGLGDAQLNTLIDEALQGNPDLVAADARVRQARAWAQQADAHRGPTLDAQASVQSVHIPGTVMPSDTGDAYFAPKILGLSGSYALDLWGGQRAAWEAAVGRQRAGEVDAQAARLLLSIDVARTYAQLGHAYQARDLAQQDAQRAQRAQRVLGLAQQREKAGIDGATEVRQAESVAATAAQRLAQANHGIESEQSALAVLLGQGPARGGAIARPAPLQPLALAWPDNLPAELLGRRPDIVAARWRVEAAQRDIDAAKTSFYPSFNLTAALGLVSFHVDDLVSLRSRYYSVAPAISLPMFDGGRLRANLAGRDAEYDVAVAQYNKTLVTAVNQVALQMQTAQSLNAQLTAQQQAVAAARAAWQLATQRYQRGIGSYFDVLLVEQSVLAAETTLTQLHTQQVDAAIQLIHALGGGYQATTDNTPQTAKASS